RKKGATATPDATAPDTPATDAPAAHPSGAAHEVPTGLQPVPGRDAAPVLPDLAALAGEAFTPVATGDGGALMPRRTPPAPRSSAAAQDILPRSGRKPRHVRDSPVPERTSAEAFWTARHRPTATDALRVDGRPTEPFLPPVAPAPLPVREPSRAAAPAAPGNDVAT
ncbi:hypothetical protein GTR02_22065, partial [Kineococcus sp. R8]